MGSVGTWQEFTMTGTTLRAAAQWLSSLYRSSRVERGGRTPGSPDGTRPFRPSVETLEDRLVPAEIVATFPGSGTYRYNDNQFYGPTGWRQLTPVVAQSAAITEQDGSGGYGVVVASFPGYGTFRYRDDKGGWQQLTPAVASQVDIDGAFVVAEFQGSGVWEWDGNWHQLTTANASSVAVGSDGSVVGEFPGAGTWRHDALIGGSWQQLTTSDANKVTANGAGYVTAAFNGAGLYQWSASTGWRGLTSLVPVNFAMNGSEDVAVSFNGSGIYLYDGFDRTWTHVSPAVTNQIGIEGDKDVDFASSGVVLYHDLDGSLTQLTGTYAGLLSGGK
jgi:hypothetical protein